MNAQRTPFRNKLMLLGGLLTAGMLAAPGAFAHDHHYNSRYSGYHDYNSHYSHRSWHHHGHDNDVGALLAGAIIGGVIVNAIDNSHDYSRTYYAPPSGYYYNNGYYDRGYGATYYGNGYAPTYYPPGYYGDGY